MTIDLWPFSWSGKISAHTTSDVSVGWVPHQIHSSITGDNVFQEITSIHPLSLVIIGETIIRSFSSYFKERHYGVGGSRPDTVDVSISIENALGAFDFLESEDYVDYSVR